MKVKIIRTEIEDLETTINEYLEDVSKDLYDTPVIDIKPIDCRSVLIILK